MIILFLHSLDKLCHFVFCVFIKNLNIDETERVFETQTSAGALLDKICVILYGKFVVKKGGG